MRAQQYNHHSLSDLEWLVVPAVMTGQFSLAEAQSKANGLNAPVGVLLWASVSAEVDKRLLATYLPPPPGLASPATWGNENWIDDVFAERARSISFHLRTFNFRYRSTEHFLEFFRK